MRGDVAGVWRRCCLRLAVATVGREPRSSDHFLLQLEGDARVVAAVVRATQQSWADVVAGRGMHNFFRVRDVTRASASGVTGVRQEGGWLA